MHYIGRQPFQLQAEIVVHLGAAAMAFVPLAVDIAPWAAAVCVLQYPDAHSMGTSTLQARRRQSLAAATCVPTLFVEWRGHCSSLQ